MREKAKEGKGSFTALTTCHARKSKISHMSLPLLFWGVEGYLGAWEWRFHLSPLTHF